MDADLLLTLANNDCHQDEQLKRQLSLERIPVPFASFFGFTLELLIFFIAGSDFYATSETGTEPAYVWYIVRWAAEELLLFVSWEFWERPAFRTVMLKQLAVRNMIFQARYLPSSYHTGRLEEVFLLQPIVVLTLAAMHIVIERASSTEVEIVSEVRALVSRLVSEVGMHGYLGLIALQWRNSWEMPQDYLWLRTVLLTMVFQMDMLMFAVLLVVWASGTPSLVRVMFDAILIVSAVGLLQMRMKDKAGVKISFGLAGATAVARGIRDLTADNIAQSILTLASLLHPLLEMLGFVAELEIAWFGSPRLSLAGPLLFFVAFLSSCLGSEKDSSEVSTQPRSSIYMVEVILSFLSFLCLSAIEDAPGYGAMLNWASLMLSSFACMLSCAGLRDLLHIARF